MRKKAKIDVIRKLPDEILNKIFEYLPLFSLLKTTETCKNFEKIIYESKTIWNLGLTKSFLEKKNEKLSEYQEFIQKYIGIDFIPPKVFDNGIQHVNLDILEKKDVNRSDLIRFSKNIHLLLKVNQIFMQDDYLIPNFLIYFIIDSQKNVKISKQICFTYEIDESLIISYDINEIIQSKTWKKIIDCFKKYESFLVRTEEIDTTPIFLVSKYEGYIIGFMGRMVTLFQ